MKTIRNALVVSLCLLASACTVGDEEDDFDPVSESEEDTGELSESDEDLAYGYGCVTDCGACYWICFSVLNATTGICQRDEGFCPSGSSNPWLCDCWVGDGGY